MATTFTATGEYMVHRALEHYARHLLVIAANVNDAAQVADIKNDLSLVYSLMRTIDNGRERCSLVRTDDHGNETVMFTDLDRDDAKVLYRIMSERGHKQSYEIRRVRREGTAEQA